jgi:hypothetical protein
MPSTYSPSLRIELIGAGEQSGTWGTTTNTNLGTLLEQSIAGVQAITMFDANYTLTNYNGVSDEARKAVLVVSGTNAAIRDVIAPLVTKSYTIKNNTTGGFAISIRAATGASVSIPNGVTSLVYCDGTNFVLAVNQTSVAAGTGISVGVVGATNTISFGPITSAQLATAVSDETGSGAVVFATSPTLVTPNLGTPSTLVGTNITGTAASLTAGNVTTNANLTGAVTSAGNTASLGSFTSAQLATALTDETGTGANVFATSPTLVTPNLGTPATLVGTNITGTAAGLTAGNATNATNATTSTTQTLNTSDTSIATTQFANPASSLAANGYVKLPSGIIIQWGTMSGTGTHGTSYSFTFPLAFPTACQSISATVQQGIATLVTSVFLPITALSTTGATVQYGSINGGSYTYSYRWQAIGY